MILTDDRVTIDVSTYRWAGKPYGSEPIYEVGKLMGIVQGIDHASETALVYWENGTSSEHKLTDLELWKGERVERKD